MIETQLRARGIADERVLAAMASLPRERFVPTERRAIAYADEALPIDAGQTISQPYMVARMTELLAPRVGDRVLDVGTGSGYQAAVLALLGARVVSIERHPDLADAARERLAVLGFADRVGGPARRRQRRRPGRRTVGRDPRRGRRAGDPQSAPRAAIARGRPACDPCRRSAAAGSAPCRPARGRMARIERRPGDLRARLSARRGSPRLRWPPLTARAASAARYTRPAMTHVFVAPHPDDVALSCGGLIASLRELGQNVTILTVFSGTGVAGDLSPYQREALGFGNKAIWPVTEAFNRANISNDYPVDGRSRHPAAVGGDDRPASTRPRPTPTPPRSASGSARRGIAGRASATSRSPASRSSTTCRPRAPS